MRTIQARDEKQKYKLYALGELKQDLMKSAKALALDISGWHFIKPYMSKSIQSSTHIPSGHWAKVQ